MEIGLWLLVGVLAVALAYTMQFTTATLTLGRELAGSTTKRGFQDAITPPWQTNLALVVYIGITTVAFVMWWRMGWPSALAGMVAIFVGSLIAGFIVPQEPGGHYRRLILQSMIARYANYVRDGDVLRADAMKQLLIRAGIDCDSTHDVPTKSESNHPSRQDITDTMLQVAETLKTAYSRLLEMGGPSLKPASMLPASKEKIKAALLLLALHHKTNGRLDKGGVEIFRRCYGCLAEFVTDDVAENQKKFDELVLDPEAAKRIQDDPMSIATAISETAFPDKEMTASTEEFVRLCGEFEHRLNALEDPGSKSQELAIIRNFLLENQE